MTTMTEYLEARARVESFHTILLGRGDNFITITDPRELAYTLGRLLAGPPVSREDVAGLIANDLLRQEGDDPRANPFGDDSLTWPYIDQGHVNFGQIADAIQALYRGETK